MIFMNFTINMNACIMQTYPQPCHFYTILFLYFQFLSQLKFLPVCHHNWGHITATDSPDVKEIKEEAVIISLRQSVVRGHFQHKLGFIESNPGVCQTSQNLTTSPKFLKIEFSSMVTKL